MLWVTTSDWLRWYDSWMNDPLADIDAEKVDKNVSEAYKTIHKCVKVFTGIPGQCLCPTAMLIDVLFLPFFRLVTVIDIYTEEQCEVL